MKPGKPEKIRFGQAPRESLPSSQVASAAAPGAGPSVTVPENRYVNPDGTVSSSIDAAPEKKTRLSARPPVKKVKTPKNLGHSGSAHPRRAGIAEGAERAHGADGPECGQKAQAEGC